MKVLNDKYKLDTLIVFTTSLGRETESAESTMEELGFTSYELENSTEAAIEEQLNMLFEDWENNHLDSGWTISE